MDYYSAIRKKKSEILPSAATLMDLEGIGFSEVAQTEEGVLSATVAAEGVVSERAHHRRPLHAGPAVSLTRS